MRPSDTQQYILNKLKSDGSFKLNVNFPKNIEYFIDELKELNIVTPGFTIDDIQLISNKGNGDFFLFTTDEISATNGYDLSFIKNCNQIIKERYDSNLGMYALLYSRIFGREKEYESCGTQIQNIKETYDLIISDCGTIGEVINNLNEYFYNIVEFSLFCGYINATILKYKVTNNNVFVSEKSILPLGNKSPFDKIRENYGMIKNRTYNDENIVSVLTTPQVTTKVVPSELTKFGKKIGTTIKVKTTIKELRESNQLKFSDSGVITFTPTFIDEYNIFRDNLLNGDMLTVYLSIPKDKEDYIVEHNIGNYNAASILYYNPYQEISSYTQIPVGDSGERRTEIPTPIVRSLTGECPLDSEASSDRLDFVNSISDITGDRLLATLMYYSLDKDIINSAIEFDYESYNEIYTLDRFENMYLIILSNLLKHETFGSDIEEDSLNSFALYNEVFNNVYLNDKNFRDDIILNELKKYTNDINSFTSIFGRRYVMTPGISNKIEEYMKISNLFLYYLLGTKFISSLSSIYPNSSIFFNSDYDEIRSLIPSYETFKTIYKNNATISEYIGHPCVKIPFIIYFTKVMFNNKCKEDSDGILKSILEHYDESEETSLYDYLLENLDIVLLSRLYRSYSSYENQFSLNLNTLGLNTNFLNANIEDKVNIIKERANITQYSLV